MQAVQFSVATVVWSPMEPSSRLGHSFIHSFTRSFGVLVLPGPGLPVDDRVANETGKDPIHFRGESGGIQKQMCCRWWC